MAKRLSCRDMGNDCGFVVCGRTEEEVYQKTFDHAKADHNLREIPKEFIRKARLSVRDVDQC
jgi:predicted small metal-binding protein